MNIRWQPKYCICVEKRMTWKGDSRWCSGETELACKPHKWYEESKSFSWATDANCQRSYGESAIIGGREILPSVTRPKVCECSKFFASYALMAVKNSHVHFNIRAPLVWHNCHYVQYFRENSIRPAARPVAYFRARFGLAISKWLGKKKLFNRVLWSWNSWDVQTQTQ